LFLDNFFILKKEYWLEDYFFEIEIHHKKTNIAQNGHSAFEKEQKRSMKTTKHAHTHTHKALMGQIGLHPRDKIKLNYNKGWGGL